MQERVFSQTELNWYGAIMFDLPRGGERLCAATGRILIGPCTVWEWKGNTYGSLVAVTRAILESEGDAIDG